MSSSLRIVVAAGEDDMHRYYRMILPEMGHSIIAVVGSGGELIDRCERCMPDLILGECELTDMLGVEAVRQINIKHLIPAILLCRFDHEELVHAADCPIIHLVKPVGKPGIRSAIRDGILLAEQHRQH